MGETGFAVVLHINTFEHSLAICRASHGKFSHVWKFIMIFGKHLFYVDESIKVIFQPGFCAKYYRQALPLMHLSIFFGCLINEKSCQ